MQIRARSKFALVVAGVAFAALNEWKTMEIERNKADLETLLRLEEDPGVQVQVNKAQEDGGEDWQPLTSIEEVRKLYAAQPDDETAETTRKSKTKTSAEPVTPAS